MNSIQKKIKDNFITITIFNDTVSPEFAEEIVDYLVKIPCLCEAFKNRLFVRNDPKDLFILSLTELRDTGDIDCLVRALNWQHNDIAYLSHQLQYYERSLVKLDSYRKECARLKDLSNKLRERNSELIKALKDSHT